MMRNLARFWLSATSVLPQSKLDGYLARSGKILQDNRPILTGVATNTCGRKPEQIQNE